MYEVKIAVLSLSIAFLSACEPPPAPVVPAQSNNLGEAKWGELTYESKI